MAGLGVSSFQLVLLGSLMALGLSATIPESQLHQIQDGREFLTVADSSINPEGVVPMVSRFAPGGIGGGLSRAKRYIGWGRKPGLRYSKANWDFDTTFNKFFNKYEKRDHDAPDAPISHFRELKMKQKIPNVQNLLPHLFNRNNRFAETDPQGAAPDVVDVTEEDVEALLYLLEEYASKHGRLTPNEQ